MRRQANHDDEARPPAPKPRDAGTLAAGEALRAALGRGLGGAREAGLAILHVPDETWAAAVTEAWRALVRDGHAPRRVGSLYDSERQDRETPWTTFAQDGRTALNVEDVERALTYGVPVLVVAAAPGWVPPMIAALADLKATLQPLGWQALRWATTRAAGMPSTRGLAEPSASTLAAVSPRLLRLAYRPSGGAHGLLRRALAAAAETAGAGGGRILAPAPRGLEGVPGLGEATAWGYRLAEDLAEYAAGRLGWADVDRGLLLSGPPGVGKTTFARSLAVTCGVPLVVGSHADWQARGHQGDLLRAMKATFVEARRSAPCILFLDEADSFPDRSTSDDHNGGYTRQVVNALLAEMDGVATREGVVIVAACNDPGALDPALVRSGRLDRHVHLDLPDAGALAAILRVHLGPLLPDADLIRLGGLAEGASGADVERLVREARATARRAGRPMAETDLLAAIVGPDEDDRDPDFLWRVAVHEAGHAIAHEALRPGRLVEVSIRQRMGLGGYTRTVTTPDEVLTPTAVQLRLVCMLAGRAAEELVLGEPSGSAGMGGHSDLAQATRLAAMAVAALGFDEEAGLVWQGLPPSGDATARWLAVRPAVAARVRALLAEAQGEARRLVMERREAVVAVAEALLERRTMTGEEVRAVLASASRSVAAERADIALGCGVPQMAAWA